MSTPLTVLLGLALIPAGGVVSGGDPRGLIALGLCGTALSLLYRNRSSLDEVTVTTTAPVTAATTDLDGQTEPTPPGRDPLGTAPFAWDLPDPRPALPPPPRSRSKVTPITLGLALLTAGVAAAFLPAISPAQVAAVGLGVIGLGP